MVGDARAGNNFAMARAALLWILLAAASSITVAAGAAVTETTVTTETTGQVVHVITGTMSLSVATPYAFVDDPAATAAVADAIAGLVSVPSSQVSVYLSVGWRRLSQQFGPGPAVQQWRAAAVPGGQPAWGSSGARGLSSAGSVLVDYSIWTYGGPGSGEVLSNIAAALTASDAASTMQGLTSHSLGSQSLSYSVTVDSVSAPTINGETVAATVTTLTTTTPLTLAQATQSEASQASSATFLIASIVAGVVVVVCAGLCLARVAARKWRKRGPGTRQEDNGEVWDPEVPSFYFIPASWFSDSTTSGFVHMQQLREQMSLVKRSIRLSEAFGNPDSMKRILFVSHRWEVPGRPDTLGMQFAAVKEHLQDNPHIQYVWYDYCCMPQDTTSCGGDIVRTPKEKAEFDRMLRSIADLYLTSSVLILMDKTYMTRFWTLMEAWCSMVTPTSSGARAATDADSRFTIKNMHNATSEDRRALRVLVFGKTPGQIHDTLASPDVCVTNAKDKERMLPVVLQIDSHISEQMQIYGNEPTTIEI